MLHGLQLGADVPAARGSERLLGGGGEGQHQAQNSPNIMPVPSRAHDWNSDRIPASPSENRSRCSAALNSSNEIVASLSASEKASASNAL